MLEVLLLLTLALPPTPLTDAVGSLGVVGNPFEVPVGMRGELSTSAEHLMASHHAEMWPSGALAFRAVCVRCSHDFLLLSRQMAGSDPAPTGAPFLRGRTVGGTLASLSVTEGDDSAHGAEAGSVATLRRFSISAASAADESSTSGERQTSGSDPDTEAHYPRLALSAVVDYRLHRACPYQWFGASANGAVPLSPLLSVASLLRFNINAAPAVADSSTQEEQGKPDYVLRTGAVFLTALTVAEIEVTRAVLERGGEEQNPIYKPFADHPGVLGLVNGAVTGGLGLVALELNRRGKKTEARIFVWTMVAAKVVVFTHNVRELRKTDK